MIWPDWMDEAGLMAKSQQKGGETLAEHTYHVLERLSDLVRLHPQLVQDDERLWHRLYWGCFLHDFGKAADGFQKMLQGEPTLWTERRQRHEILSLAFVDWVFPKDHIDRPWVIAVVAFHHKDSIAIFEQYGGDKSTKDMLDEDKKSILEIMLPHLAQQISQEVAFHLWRWLDECALAWANELKIPILEKPALIEFDRNSSTPIEHRIFRVLREFHQWQATVSAYHLMLYRGLILTADHAASANSPAFPPMPLTDTIAEKPLQGHIKRHHQEQMQGVPTGSVLMIAPTGSGKTEAALLWAAGQMAYQPAARLFYTLPYQASMNAMAERLAWRYFGIRDITDKDNQIVTIQHSRVRLKFYQMMMDEEDADSKVASKDAKWLQNLARLNYFPIQVFSPYQMLKAAYSLKGYEVLLADYANALFIFDEIHAYEPKRLALIIRFMGWLARNYGARFLIMTATLPPTVKKALQDALPDLTDPQHIVEADAKLFRKSQRHVVHIHDGELFQQVDGIIADDINAGKTVLVCCNRVARAQDVYRCLKFNLGLIPDEEIVLLHGRFSNGDRGKKERLLQVVRSGKKPEPRPKRFVLVATQAVEVSLDIDLDVLYTDPAPLEAMLQRFGRVNRGRKHRGRLTRIMHPKFRRFGWENQSRKEELLCPVNVFREPDTPEEGKDPLYLPYDRQMVERSIEVLEQFCGGGKPVDESLVTEMLGEIYKDEIAERWRKDYKGVESSFEATILGTMKPFQSATRDMWEQFQKLFDGVEVLPWEYAAAYDETVEKEGYLAASRYLVNISHKKLSQLRQRGLVLPREPDTYVDQIKVSYDPEWGLALDEALRGETSDE